MAVANGQTKVNFTDKKEKAKRLGIKQALRCERCCLAAVKNACLRKALQDVLNEFGTP